MTELVLKMSISLDGYVARPDGSNDWIFPSYTPDATAWTVETLRGASAHVMGSVTYRAMAAHWPRDTSDFAAPMNDIPKVVFSETTTVSEWGDTRFLSGDLAEGIATLKEKETPDYLLAHGGASFVRSLCQTGLIDEMRLLVHPVVLGEGERIFPNPMDLTTVATTAFSGGAVAHVLRPRNWISRCRRTVRDHERLPAHHAAIVNDHHHEPPTRTPKPHLNRFPDGRSENAST